MSIDLSNLKNLKKFKLVVPNIQDLKSIKDFKLILPHKNVNLYLKMNKAEGCLETLLSNLQLLNFLNIEGEFKEIECDQSLTEIILSRNLNIKI